MYPKKRSRNLFPILAVLFSASIIVVISGVLLVLSDQLGGGSKAINPATASTSETESPASSKSLASESKGRLSQ